MITEVNLHATIRGTHMHMICKVTHTHTHRHKYTNIYTQIYTQTQAHRKHMHTQTYRHTHVHTQHGVEYHCRIVHIVLSHHDA